MLHLYSFMEEILQAVERFSLGGVSAISECYSKLLTLEANFSINWNFCCFRLCMWKTNSAGEGQSFLRKQIN